MPVISGSPGASGRVLKGREGELLLDRPQIVGILNVTPDSFSDGGRFMSLESAVAQGRRMAAEGAAMIDIGGESTRPGAPAVPAAEELARVVPVVEALRRELALPLSVDTSKSEVAAAALDAGADYVNDISGLSFDPEMAAVVAARKGGLIVMHTRGRPDVMQRDTAYRDIVAEVMSALRGCIDAALAAGIAADRIAVDPGIGFGKDVAGNLELLKRLAEFSELGYPVMLGTSRKSFIGQVLDQSDPKERLAGTLATVALGCAAGARLFRVHDVASCREAALISWAISKGQDWASG